MQEERPQILRGNDRGTDCPRQGDSSQHQTSVLGRRSRTGATWGAQLSAALHSSTETPSVSASFPLRV